MIGELSHVKASGGRAGCCLHGCSDRRRVPRAPQPPGAPGSGAHGLMGFVRLSDDICRPRPSRCATLICPPPRLHYSLFVPPSVLDAFRILDPHRWGAREIARGVSMYIANQIQCMRKHPEQSSSRDHHSCSSPLNTSCKTLMPPDLMHTVFVAPMYIEYGKKIYPPTSGLFFGSTHPRMH